MTSHDTHDLKLDYAVIKLLNGEEIICKVQKGFVENYKDLYDNSKSVTIYTPLKASVEQYFEKQKGDKVSVFEQTILTSWVRFAYLNSVELPYTQILAVGTPPKSITDKYDDLSLKYYTYANNPELANSLWSTPDVSEFFSDDLDDPDKNIQEHIDDEFFNDEDEDEDEDDDYYDDDEDNY